MLIPSSSRASSVHDASRGSQRVRWLPVGTRSALGRGRRRTRGKRRVGPTVSHRSLDATGLSSCRAHSDHSPRQRVGDLSRSLERKNRHPEAGSVLHGPKDPPAPRLRPQKMLIPSSSRASSVRDATRWSQRGEMAPRRHEERFGPWTPPDPWKTTRRAGGFPLVLGRDRPVVSVAPTATTARASG